jgi:hypothetical protein
MDPQSNRIRMNLEHAAQKLGKPLPPEVATAAATTGPTNAKGAQGATGATSATSAPGSAPTTTERKERP